MEYCFFIEKPRIDNGLRRNSMQVFVSLENICYQISIRDMLNCSQIYFFSMSYPPVAKELNFIVAKITKTIQNV